MATNNFLPFCPTDTGTNLPTQGDYAVAADRTIGNQPGVASSKLNNKAIRQANVIASQIAQYLSDKMSVNALDDGNLANILALMNSGFAPLDSYNIENLTLAASVGSSALTVSVKTQSGGDPSSTDIVYVGMRSSTLTSGVFNRRSISSALSMTVSNGSTLGQTSAAPSAIYVYLIDNAGTLELAVSHSLYAENQLVTTIAEGGAGAADSATAIYSTTARSNVPLRLIGIMTNTQATAGTWATVPSQIQLSPFKGKNSVTVQTFTSGSGTYNTPAGCTRIRVRLVGGGGGGGGSGSSASGGAGGAGGNTTFGTTLLSGSGGGPSTAYNTTGGGAASLGTGPVGIAISGGRGMPGTFAPGGSCAGSNGASSPFGGEGGGANPGLGAGNAGVTNSGSGGGGGGGNGSTIMTGGGGSAGGYVDATIINPLSSYAYAVGAGGTAGGAGTGGAAGGAGGSGYIIVEEFYD